MHLKLPDDHELISFFFNPPTHECDLGKLLYVKEIFRFQIFVPAGNARVNTGCLDDGRNPRKRDVVINKVDIDRKLVELPRDARESI